MAADNAARHQQQLNKTRETKLIVTQKPATMRKACVTRETPGLAIPLAVAQGQARRDAARRVPPFCIARDAAA